MTTETPAPAVRPFLDTEGAAAYLQTTWNLPLRASTLTRKRTEGEGPKYSRVGRRPMYSPDHLDAWVRARPAHEATVDEATAAKAAAAKATAADLLGGAK